MASVVLRVYGDPFDVDKFIKENKCNVLAVHKKGEGKGKRISKYSGFNMDIYGSNRSNVNFRRIISFIHKNKALLNKIKNMKDVSGTIDIGIMEDIKFIFVKVDKRFLELVKIYDLDLEMSFYPG